MKTTKSNLNTLPVCLFSAFMAFFTCIFLLTDRHREVASAVDMLNAMNGASIAALCIVLCGFFFYRHLFTVRDSRALGFAVIGGIVFALCDSVGFNIYYRDSLTRADANLFSLVLDLSVALGSFFLFSGILYGCFHYVQLHPIARKETAFSKKWLGCSWRSFWLVFGILMAISIPLQIFFYPGITNVDSFAQLSDSLGLSPLTDHHPFLHTLMMGAVVRLGILIFGNIADGIMVYTFFQSVLASMTVAFLLTYMANRGIHWGLRLATLLYFAIHPAIACYNITVWKDIWLSYFLLLYTLLLMEAALNPDHFFRKNSHMAVLLLVILGFLFSKNTGIAVLLLSLPFLFITARKHFRKVAAVAVLALAVWGVVRVAVIPALGIQKGFASAPLSVPLQQIARTCTHEGETLTEDQRSVLNEILPVDRLPDLYQPYLSDNVKMSMNNEAYSRNPSRYLKCWLQLGSQHPRMYLESFLANSCGYWYPDVIYWVVDPTWYFTSLDCMEAEGDPDPNADNYDVDLSRYDQRHYFVHLYEMLQTVPGISSLISVAISFWAEFVLFLICLMKKKHKMLLPLLVPFATWIICIFSPVIAEYRYAFPAVVCLPILAAFTLQDDLDLTENLGIPRKRSRK